MIDCVVLFSKGDVVVGLVDLVFSKRHGTSDVGVVRGLEMFVLVVWSWLLFMTNGGTVWLGEWVVVEDDFLGEGVSRVDPGLSLTVSM